ncbi:MAG: 4'-phosphopantetheinyl transferase superfamily protein [Myxococcales bacterium]
MTEPAAPPFSPLPSGGSILPAEGEVVLLCAPLDVPGAALARMRQSFAPREEARARRFVPQYRDRWVAGRGHLRQILARATRGDPAALRFVYGAHGKPALDPRSAPALDGPPLTFNVSHSGALGLYALARGREVGVDIEHIRPRKTDQVAARFFHARESAALRALTDDEARRAAFFRVWCCKEAFIKATGAGLSQSMSSFEFVLGPGGPRAVAWHRDDAGAAARWSVHLLAPAAGYAAALIAERTAAQAEPSLRQYQWSGPGAAL